ncbi:MAG: HK97 gp10 family phage protein [Thermomicrobiales bacterium]
MPEMDVTARLIYDHLPLISKEFANHAVKVMNRGVTNFLRITAETIPRDTSHMANNITVKRASEGNYEASVTYNADYSLYVHGGTRYQAAQPWASDAVDLIWPDYQREMMAMRLPSGG